METVQISVIERTKEFDRYGHFAREKAIAHEPKPGETVDGLAERLLGGFMPRYDDWLEIRIAKPAQNKYSRFSLEEAKR